MAFSKIAMAPSRAKNTQFAKYKVCCDAASELGHNLEQFSRHRLCIVQSNPSSMTTRLSSDIKARYRGSIALDEHCLAPRLVSQPGRACMGRFDGSNHDRPKVSLLTKTTTSSQECH